jgi:hypothetical protein
VGVCGKRSRSLTKLRLLLLASMAMACAWHAAPADAYVYWGNISTNTIGRANLDGTGVNQSFITGLRGVRGVAVNSTHIFWANNDFNSIGRANLDGTGANNSFIFTAGAPNGVALSAAHVHWSTSAGNVGRANLDGTGVNNSPYPNVFVNALGGLAVSSNFLYVAHQSGIVRINIANGTGSNFIPHTISYPLDIAVQSGRLYWPLFFTSLIGRANVDGTDVNEQFISAGLHPQGIAVDANRVYWTLPEANAIGRARISGSGAHQTFITGAGAPRGIAVDAGGGGSVEPTVTTDVATSVTGSGASLRSTINPGGAETTYKYEYGQTTAFGTLVPASGTLSAGSGTSPVSQPAQAISGLSPATTYYHRVCANNQRTGPGVGNQVCGAVRSFTTPGGPTAPSATTGPSSSIANTSAQVDGTVNAHGAGTAYVFEYGTSTAFGQIAPIPAGNAGSGTAGLPVTRTLTSLQPNTTYLYRLVATNSQGTTRGAVMSFTTTGPATAPVVTTGAATNVGSGTATLNGTVNPKGRATTYTFEYGTTTSFGSITAVDNAGNAGSALPVSLAVSGLSPSTTYLYRIVATNSAGTSTAPVMSLKTTAVTPIYWADGTDIGRASADGSGVNKTFIDVDGNVRGVAFDSQYVYWSNSTNQTIGRANRDGTGVNQSFITLSNTPHGIAVDAGHIYWANFFGGVNSIGRASIDGSGVSESFITGLDAPSQVAVGPAHVYWVNFSTDSIGRANLDGTGVNKTFITVGERPTSLAVDPAHIYWTGLNSEAMGRANLDGSGVNLSFIAGLNGPQGVAVDSTHVFWSSFETGSIGRANLNGTSPNHSFITGLGSPGALASAAG